MKVVYLDLDGVVNQYHLSKPWTRPDGSIQNPSIGTKEEFEGTLGFDYDKVERLNKVFDDSDWSIVISSSWYLTSRTLRALIKYGFRHNHRIVGEICRWEHGRGAQILHHVDNHHRITDFITIEDEPYDILGGHESVTEEMRSRFENRVFSPNPYEGLQDDMVLKIKERLNV